MQLIALLNPYPGRHTYQTSFKCSCFSCNQWPSVVKLMITITTGSAHTEPATGTICSQLVQECIHVEATKFTSFRCTTGKCSKSIASSNRRQLLQYDVQLNTQSSALLQFWMLRGCVICKNRNKPEAHVHQTCTIIAYHSYLHTIVIQCWRGLHFVAH